MHYSHKTGRVFRAIREHMGFSQDFMAESIGVCQSTYAHFESGKSAITIDRLVQVAEVLGIHPLHILDQILGAESTGDILPANYPPPLSTDTKEAYTVLIEEMRNEIGFLRQLALRSMADSNRTAVSHTP